MWINYRPIGNKEQRSTSTMMCGAEIWRCKEQDKIKGYRIQKYIRWVLGLNRDTPGYIVGEECKRYKMRVESVKSGYEEKP